MNNIYPKNKFNLGKKDKITNYKSKWLIYELDIFDKNGLWLKFKTELKKIEKEEKLKKIDIEEIHNFFQQSPDIDFEIKYFSNLMDKNYIFKINDNIYSYTTGYKSKRKFYVRFYFDLNNFFTYATDD
jgi:hypothetical protein